MCAFFGTFSDRQKISQTLRIIIVTFFYQRMTEVVSDFVHLEIQFALYQLKQISWSALLRLRLILYCNFMPRQ